MRNPNNLRISPSFAKLKKPANIQFAGLKMVLRAGLEPACLNDT